MDIDEMLAYIITIKRLNHLLKLSMLLYKFMINVNIFNRLAFMQTFAPDTCKKLKYEENFGMREKINK